MELSSSKIVHDARGQKKLITYNPVQGRPVTQVVREEDEYIEHIGKIIQRDFFPDLTSASEDSTSITDSISSKHSLESASKSDSRNPEKADPTAVSLDKYLANNTTEDDASFTELIEDTERKHRIKLAPFFPSIKDAESTALTSETHLALTGSKPAIVGPRASFAGNNSIHFNPDGVAQSKDELLDHISNERKIVPSNTRFKRPFPCSMDKKRTFKNLIMSKLGHVGVDGKEHQTPYSTPQAGGYKFMDASPSPTFSLSGHSPFMTWGELDATPSRLDEGFLTPNVMSGAPAFHIPSPSEREQLAHKLADKAGRQRARDRLEAVKRVRPGSSSPSSALLSPAARRLLASSSSILHTDSKSRPSTGTSQMSLGRSPRIKTNTPRRLPSDLGVIRRPTPNLSNLDANDPKNSNDLITDKDTKSSKSECSPSITDNLLNLRTSQGCI